MTSGRVAWNVVTSLNNSEAANFGHEEHLEHDLRYDRADEFMEVVTGLWDSWEDDALIVDKQTGRFADPDKVHRLDYSGKYFKSKGPLTVPRSAQGHPVLLQAGQSGRGMAFAARWAELVFASYPTLEVGRKNYAYLKGEVEKAGRDPSMFKIAPAVKVIVAETAAQAEEQRALTASMAKPIDSLALLCEVLNVDFAKRGYDQPFTDEELASLSWQSLRDRVIAKTGKKNPSVRDFVEASGRGQLNDGPVFCGTPEPGRRRDGGMVRDGLRRLRAVGDARCRAAYEDIARLVVPELQRRGLFRQGVSRNDVARHTGCSKTGAAFVARDD